MKRGTSGGERGWVVSIGEKKGEGDSRGEKGDEGGQRILASRGTRIFCEYSSTWIILG